MDIGPHAKTLSTAVTSVCLGYLDSRPRGRWMSLTLGPRRYHVLLVPDSAAAAPLSHFSHRLYILCRQPRCDLSPLFALAGPLDYPHHAARVVRTLVTLEDKSRWLPGCEPDVFKNPPNAGRISPYAKGALDILADPMRLQTLFRLVYDRSREARALGYKLGLWTLNPEEAPGSADELERGSFTVAASAALLYVAHMVPFEKAVASHLSIL